ncbi:hypothetical protein GZ77_11400 [Endozoicomonas montiporae]|uniref:Uncharacterized protein n=2 Tax=Endozoicomonas montiporae TaxID=1027273 RepID=A0A081N8U3_9GAMM|nr:hypothetical protein [Endozoicomonas montiporae]AMO55220.1 hypothetical protein EZMO1_1006 [Endozoicomonas montiporae CL-33]KEQ14866.1 hypothetical protein GZ77_11400 [Endozoicomonas montiporae]
MSSGITPGSGVQPPPITSTGGAGAAGSLAATGTHNGNLVTEVKNPERHMDAIQPKQTSDQNLHERSASLPSTPPAKELSGAKKADPEGKTDKAETPKEKHKREVEEARAARENSSVEELEAEQEALIKEAGEKYEKIEEYTVLGKAMAALRHPEEAEKGVKVILHLPGETKPIRLVPPDKKALKGRDVEALIKLAEDLLKEYNNTVFSGGFNKDEFNQRIDVMRDMLSDIVSKIAEKDKSKSGSNWQKRLEDMQQKRSVIHVKQPEAVDGEEAELKVERLDEKQTEQLLKDLEIIEPVPEMFFQKAGWVLRKGVMDGLPWREKRAP